jgi:hypothetical protein
MPYGKNFYNQDINTGLGLIFRLNFLMQELEYAVLDGNYQRWNTLLDRLYCNIMYKNSLEILKDEDQNILSVELSNEDKRVYIILNKMVKAAFKSKKRIQVYNALMKKELFLKKKMFELNIYLKQVTSDPGSAIFGG